MVAIFKTLFAYIALWAVMASVGYYGVTRASAETPLMDSLTPEQRRVQAASACKRRRVFAASAATAGVLLVLWRPFNFA
jgi:hypothetical protein